MDKILVGMYTANLKKKKNIWIKKNQYVGTLEFETLPDLVA